MLDVSAVAGHHAMPAALLFHNEISKTIFDLCIANTVMQRGGVPMQSSTILFF